MRTEKNAVGLKNRDYNFIDLMKFICAALVVSIHVSPLSGIDWRLNYILKDFISRIAVPFFFVSSAYFVFLKAYDEKGVLNKGVILNYIKRILRLYIIWSCIYAPFAFYHIKEIMPDVSVPGFLKYYTIRFFLSTSYGHLWYLNAVIVAYLIFLILIFLKIRPKAIAGFSLVMYCLGLLAQSWFGMILPLRRFTAVWSFLLNLKMIFNTTRNGLCDGLIFILIGLYFAKYRPYIKSAYCLFIGSVLFYAAEFLIVSKLGWIREFDMYLGLIPTVFLLFYISLNINLPDRPIYKKLRNISGLVYFSHMLIVECLIILPCLNNLPGGGLTEYILTLFLSVAFSAAVIMLSGHLPLFKYLYK